MMGLLVYRNLPTEGQANQLIQLERFSESVHDRQWMAIYFEGRKIGYAMTSIAKMTDEVTNEVTYSFLQRSYMDLRVGDSRQKITLISTAKANTDFSLKSFEANVISGIHQMNISGKIKGEELHLNFISSGRENKTVIPVDENVQLPITLEPYLATHGLETGKVYTMKVFDPMTASASPARIEVEKEDRIYVGGKRYIARKINVKYREMETTIWIDYDGRTLREVSPMGFKMIMVSEEDARRGIRTGGDPVDVLTVYSIKPAQPIPNPRELRQFKARIDGITAEGLSLESGNQTLHSTDPIILEVVQPDLSQIRSQPISQLASQVDSTWLAGTPFIQINDDKIKAQAAAIIGDETDALKAATKLQEWVYANIKKAFTMSIPSAVEVLDTLEGDCNEHTTLYTALARAAGIPARMCVGMAYVDDGFYYHAWPEVFIGEWLALDPTFGQNAVDATHLKFLEGDLDKQFDLGRVVGKVDLEILEMDWEPKREF